MRKRKTKNSYATAQRRRNEERRKRLDQYASERFNKTIQELNRQTTRPKASKMDWTHILGL